MALVVGAWACPATAQTAETKVTAPTADPDEILRAALPENALPDLKAILTSAMANAPRVALSELDVLQSQTNVTSARSSLLPRASVSASPSLIHEMYQYRDKDPVARDTVSLFYNASISQPLFHWGALKKGLDSAKLQKAIVDRNYGEVRRLLAIEVRRTYFTLISETNFRGVELKALETLTKEQDFLKNREADGFVAKGSAEGYNVVISDYKLQLRRSENAYQAKWKAFRKATGIDTLNAEGMPKEVPAVPTNVGEVLAKISSELGDYQPAELANANDKVKTEQLNYEIAKTRLRPMFDFSLGASQQNQSANNDRAEPPVLTQNYGAYFNVNWLLFDGLASQAAKRSSMISFKRQRTLRDQTERDYRDNLRDQVETLRVNWQSLQRTEEGLRDARSYVETCKNDYEAGAVPKQVWEAAEKNAESALFNTNNSRADFYLQIVNYLSLRGKDPAVNYKASNNSSDAFKN